MNKIQVIAAVRAGKKLQAIKLDYPGEELRKEILRQCEFIKKAGLLVFSVEGEPEEGTPGLLFENMGRCEK